MDRETVITHLQIIHTWAEFARERDLQFFTAKHLEDIAQWADDAIALLKEQQKTPVVFSQDDGSITTACGNCGWDLDKAYSRCPKCQRELDWNSLQG